jgi:hypothetical protein
MELEEEIKAKEEDTAMQKAMSKKAMAAAKKDAAKVPRPPPTPFSCAMLYTKKNGGPKHH